MPVQGLESQWFMRYRYMEPLLQMLVPKSRVRLGSSFPGCLDLGDSSTDHASFLA